MNKRKIYILLGVVVLLVFCTICTTGLLAEETKYPEKPICVVIPFAAGGGSDIFVRVFQHSITDNNLMEQALVVLNVPGGGSAVGSRRVKDAKPDGYEILFNHIALLSSQAGGRIDFGHKDFEPIAATCQIAPILTVREDAPWKNVDEFIKAAKENPKSINFGCNMGGMNHTAGLVLGDATKTDFNFVQIGGGAKTFASILGGHVDCSTHTAAEVVIYCQQGLRALATFSPERDPYFPDLPTFKELGYDVSLVTLQTWFAPKGTSPEKVNYLADLLEKTMQTEFAQEKLEQLKYDPTFMRGEELNAYLDDAYTKLKCIFDKLSLQ
jgi:tripartite-type tricarboxylate transporter receptor subunit TctC